MAFTHGIYTSEQATSVSAPITSDAALTIVVGTAPIHTVAGDPAKVTNVPVMVNNYEGAVKAFGYSDDFKTWTICAAVDYFFRVRGVGPLVIINVYDGEYTEQEVETLTTEQVSGKATEGSVWVTLEDGTRLTEGTDYTITYAEDNFTVTAKETVTGKKVTIHYHPAATVPSFTKEDIIGGVDEKGQASGIEVAAKVYPVLGKVGGILIAPCYSKEPEVSAALLAKSHEMNGSWEVVSYIELNSSAEGATTYTDVKEKKEAQGLTDTSQYAIWLWGMVGEKKYPPDVVAAAQTGYVDSQNDDVPYNSPSNKATPLTGACLEDGTPVYLDQEEANFVNECGVATLLNRNGWRVWGNRTAAYPASTDVKDVFLSVRRMMNWRRNNFVLTFFQKVDEPANYRLIESIVDSYNQTGNYYVSQGYCAVDQIEFRTDENPVTDILGGIIRFHSMFSPYPPAETIETTFEFDPNALATALSGE